jgi:hypothetical protein
VPKALAKVLKDLVSGGSRIDGVAFTPEGGWLVLYDGTGFRAAGVSAQCLAALREAATESRGLRSPSFEANGAFAFVMDGNGSYRAGIPAWMNEVLVELNVPGQRITSVALTNGGGMVVRGRNGWSSAGVPQGLVDAMQKAHDGNEQVDFISLSPQGGWVLLKNDGRSWVWSLDLPESLRAALSAERKQRVEFVAIAPNGGWVLVTRDL